MSFWFEESSAITSQEQAELFSALIEKALTDEHNSWEFIKNITEFGIIKKTQKGLYKVIELFDRITDSLLKEYCKQLKLERADFDLLVAVKQYQHCKLFYERELELVCDMLDEYDSYIGHGYFLDQFLWRRTREPWHLWDHRQEGPGGN